MYVKGATVAAAARTGAVQKPKDIRLDKACQDFEAVFLTMLWREMRKSARTDLGGWETFAEQAIGQSWARNGGIGLAKVIYEGMSKHLST